MNRRHFAKLVSLIPFLPLVVVGGETKMVPKLFRTLAPGTRFSSNPRIEPTYTRLGSVKGMRGSDCRFTCDHWKGSVCWFDQSLLTSPVYVLE